MAGISIADCPIQQDQIKYLVKNYSTLAYSPALRSMLKSVFSEIDFSSCSKVMLHRYLNDSLTTHYAGEFSLKYQLFRRAVRKKLVAAFETRVQDSRVDFLTINGVSSSFEIKSELDNLDKLKKQSASYMKVFEYNHAVIDIRHKKNAFQMLPASYGILYFNNGRRITGREASANHSIDPDAQLGMLTKKELSIAFDGLTERNKISHRFTDAIINHQFKETLKARYRQRWDFLVKHQHNILPIDLQFFFNRNIEPGFIYNHG